MLRKIAFIAIAGLTSTLAVAQEHLGVIQQPQTIAPSIDIPSAPQATSCGPAASAGELNSVANKIRRAISGNNLAKFNNNMASISADPCPRTRAAAYFVFLLATPPYGISRR